MRIGNTKFAVSENNPSKNWTLQQKVFDFVWFTDESATTKVALNKIEMAGSREVEFELDFKNIPKKFFVGNRIYFEVSFPRNLLPLGLDENVLDYRFIDFIDYPKRSSRGSSSKDSISYSESAPSEDSFVFSDPSSFSNYMLLFLIVPGVILLVFLVSNRKNTNNLSIKREIEKHKKEKRN